ncbi:MULTISPECIES: hypothetical protein [unclassified Mesorhizobium]|uniref:hypothetical protein n=1 Tax=unclassified Mesorhizobium TaxID=325217 RepID=UPI00333C49F2
MSRNSQVQDFGTKEWLLSSARNNPEGLLLVAAGCALLMRSRSSSAGHREQSRATDGRQNAPHVRTASGGASKAQEEASETAEAMRDNLAGIGEKVSETASQYASSAASYAEQAGRSVSEKSGRVVQQAQSTLQDTIGRMVEEQPLAFVLAGFAAGAAIAAALPASDVERRTLGPAGERLTDAAEKAGERLKSSTAKAGERLKSAAEEHGLNSDGLKEVAKDVAGTFGSALSEQQSSESVQPSSPSPRGSSGPSSPAAKLHPGSATPSEGITAKSQRAGNARSSKPARPGGKRDL